MFVDLVFIQGLVGGSMKSKDDSLVVDDLSSLGPSDRRYWTATLFCGLRAVGCFGIEHLLSDV